MHSDKNCSSKSANLKPGNNTPILSNESIIAVEENLVGDKNETKRTSDASSNSSSKCTFTSLRDTLQEQFGDELFLQNYLVEIHQVRLKTGMLFIHLFLFCIIQYHSILCKLTLLI